MIIRNLGLIDYNEACSLQERLARDVAGGNEEETLLLLEHPTVYTIGSGGDEKNILDTSIKAIRTNRGGDITYHGPGQIIGYPVIDLSRRGRDLHNYLRFLEEFIMGIAAEFGVSTKRLSGSTGVWCEALHNSAKLASIGVGVRRWVTMHGFALNVDIDPAPFALINPCGIAGCPITSLSRELGRVVSMEEVREKTSRRFEITLNSLLPIDIRNKACKVVMS